MARRAALTLLALAAFAAFPAAAAAGEFKRDRTGDAKVRGLKPSQRKALDIIGVDVTRTLFVAKIVVRFKGNFEKQMRTKALRKAGALIRLTPGQANAAASGLVSPPAFGAATAPTTIASIGSGRRLRTLSSRNGGGVVAVRRGREVVFWVARVNAIQLKNVQARSFDGRPRPRGRARRAGNLSELRALLKKPVADELGFLQSVLQAPRISTDCERVRELMEQLRDTSESAHRSLNSLASQERHGELQKLVDGIDPVIAQALAYLAGPPCFDPAAQPDPDDPGSGGPGGGDGGGGGGGTPADPSDPECDNGVDDGDDEDTLVDLANDPGCIDLLDDDEKDRSAPTGGPDCGPPGIVSRAYIDINVPNTKQIVGHRLVNDANGAPIHSQSDAGHGQQPIDIGCGAGIAVTVEDGAGASAPNPGGGIPAPANPPGESTFRFLITISNPMGSGNPGTAIPVVVRGSVNTRRL